jgi:ferritin-like metal-binding protein YciE
MVSPNTWSKRAGMSSALTRSLKLRASERAAKHASRWRDSLKKVQKSCRTTSEVLDAALIAAAQRVEHYEIAAYGTLIAFADLLGESQHASLLGQTLDEEKAPDEKLTELSQDVNVAANDLGAGESKQGKSQSGKRGRAA